MSTQYKRVSMQNIADRLQISKNAVSLALNGKPGVSDETRELVMALARKLKYGQMLTGDSNCKNILVLIPEYIRNDSHFYNDIYWSVDYRASQRGYNAIMTTVTKEMQQQCVLPPICIEMSFIGYMLIGVLKTEYVNFLISQNIICISVDHSYYGLGCKTVVTANIEGCYNLTQKVISFNHTKIGFVGSYKMTSSLYERWCGFQSALNDSGLQNDEKYHIVDNSPLETLLSNPQELCQKLRSFSEMPTAFVCGGDRIAIAMIDALKQLGYKVPEQVSVVGFDDIEMGSFVEPKLTTMHVQRKEMGRLSVDLLLKEKDGRSIPSTSSLAPEFIKRDSLTWANMK